MIVLRFCFIVRDGQAAQAVVGAEFDDENPDVAVERPVEAPEAAGGRVAGHTRVDNLVGVAFRIELLLHERRDGLLDVEAVAGRQAVAEKHDARTRGCDRRHRCGGCRRRRGFTRDRGLALRARQCCQCDADENRAQPMGHIRRVCYRYRIA